MGPKSLSKILVNKIGAPDGTRTRTVAHTPLKRARLPVSPLVHGVFLARPIGIEPMT
jgi:hypothetical protein